MSTKVKKTSQQMETDAPTHVPLFFYEDEIFRINKSGDVEFGMVTENWELYSSDSDHLDEENESDKVPKGHVAVTWHPSGKESVISEQKVKLSDRSLMPGDVVRRMSSNGSAQRGYARSVTVTAAVQPIGTKEVLSSIPASNLHPVQKFPPDVAVYLDSWIGSVRNMRFSITLKFNDKSTCIADSVAISAHFEDTRPSSGEFRNGDIFYPGQKLQGPLRYLRSAEWLFITEDMKRAKDRKQVTGLVTRVECIGVNVQWQYQTPASILELEMYEKRNKKEEIPDTPNAEDTLPEHEVEKAKWYPPCPVDYVTGEEMKRLKSLNMFDSSTVQLGDICYYTLQPGDNFLDKKAWKKQKKAFFTMEEKLAHTRLNEDEYSSSESEEDENAVVKLKDESQPDLLKGENKTETSNTGGNIARKCLPKVSTRLLRKKKLKKTRQMPTVTDSNRRETQLVVETIHTSSTVDVVWQDGKVEENLRSVDLYPIHHLDDNEFFPGDFIIHAGESNLNKYGVVQNMDHNARVANVKWFMVNLTAGTPTELGVEEVSVYDVKDHPDFRFRPGTVVFRISNIQPNQFCGGQVVDNFPDGQIRIWWANNVETKCWPQDLFRIGDYDSDEGELWDDVASEDANESDGSWETDVEGDDVEEIPERRKSRKSTDAQTNIGTVSSEQSITELVHGVMPVETSIESTNSGSNFVVLPNVPSSHRFFGTHFQPVNNKRFVKAVGKEILLLRDNLPPGIFVKSYEDRMDLYSVMIVGPRNTPYEDGLFFFDVQLPPTYPDVPPLVHFASFCDGRLNPNLYECGKVCVSLLGTWSGKGSETWTSESSVLQLLISIQGLILGPEPYYNEAGYERQRGSDLGSENSRMYNEMVLIKLVQSMTKMFVKPHAPWETETLKHMHSQGPIMIQRLRKWLNELENPNALHDSNMNNSGGMSFISISKVVVSSIASTIRKSLTFNWNYFGEGTSALNSSTIDVDIKSSENMHATNNSPGFPLFPVSKGFSISLSKTIEIFEKLCSNTSNDN